MTPHILVVEDNRITAFELQMLLELEGYKDVETCDYGEMALEKAKGTNPPDIYIMDIGLKGEINGIEASSEIKTINPDAQFIFISGEEEKIRLAESTKTDSISFSKPIDNKKIIDAILKLIS